MAITITKSKKAPALDKPEIEKSPQAEKALADFTLEELADKYGSLEDQIVAINMNPAFTQFKLVAAELKSRIKSELEPEDAAELQGDHWVLNIGACSKSPRTVTDVAKIAQFVGQETFSQIAKVTIADCEKYLTPAQVAEVVGGGDTYTDTRKIIAKFKG